MAPTIGILLFLEKEEYMRKLAVFTIIMTVLAITMAILAFLPIPMIGWTGAYNAWSGLIYCSDKNSCLHEIGHKLDHSNKWVSSSADFDVTVHQFIITEIKGDNPGYDVILLANYPFDLNAAELYADIFLLYDGDEIKMPPELRQFYDWELARTLVEKYRRIFDEK